MKNKVVIITGGSSGIGKALALHMGRNGAKIVISGRDEKKLTETIQELTTEGIECLSVVSDVSKLSDVETLIERTVTKYQQIDVLINNAGITMRGLLMDTHPDVLQRVMDVNYMGTVYATKTALPYLLKSKGVIVGITSIAGYRGLPVRSGYSASKFAMNGFLEAIRTELRHTGVHVLLAAPGFVASNIRVAALDTNGQVAGESVRDENNMMTPETCAAIIVDAIEKRKRVVVMTFLGKMTVFFNKWWSSLVDRVVYNQLAKEKNSPLAKR